ncbi:hypothetical protein Clacol_004193 [Clathrus columnatus]|uniref:Uncharacterized protein n=1 Tax=Clathrus columnatus TaxID=1419009 RepID=A0AAV5A9X0_9AGAM|nr:hypothetical protein Clacol_004193 [Clathrus columnatus]
MPQWFSKLSKSSIPPPPIPSQRPPQQQVFNSGTQPAPNYRPVYLPHPSAVPDPYAHWREAETKAGAGSEARGGVADYTWQIPRLSLRIDDLSNPAIDIFLTNIKPQEAMRNAVISVLECLYTIQSQPRNVASVTLILRDFDGVAHTFGTPANDADKEIHFSTRHIKNNESRAQSEILGVLVHEMVHCFQYNAKGTCPGGLIEGIADFVRLRSSLAPPHWKRSPPSDSDRWDAGYERTAFFLDWIERVVGPGTIQAINEGMRRSKYDNGQVWRDVTGHDVERSISSFDTRFMTTSREEERT